MARRVRGVAQPLAHAVPLRVNPVGSASLLVQAPWNPNDAVPPGATLPLQDMFVAVTAAPFWLTVAFQALVTFVSPGKVKATVQPLSEAPAVFVRVTFAVRPPVHALLA